VLLLLLPAAESSATAAQNLPLKSPAHFWLGSLMRLHSLATPQIRSAAAGPENSSKRV
jgi:hypothetical protein